MKRRCRSYREDFKENPEALEEFKEFTQERDLYQRTWSYPSRWKNVNRKVTRVLGRWHTLRLASNDRSVIEEEGDYECFMTGIDLLDNGNLNVSYLHRKGGKYMKEFYVAEKTDTPGRYTFDYHGKNYLTFVAATEKYTIMDLETERNGKPLIVVEFHVEEGNMHVHFVSTDYNNLILYVRLEDNEVVNLWALLDQCPPHKGLDETSA
ncbi:hypothetical protein STEG23_001070 [Scotinomys teguina]